MTLITKRNGSHEIFEKEKIEKAVLKAYISCGYEDIDIEIEKDLEILCYDINESEIKWDIENIQDRIEEILMNGNRFDVAKAFILYRSKRAEQRAVTNNIDTIMTGYLNNSNWRVKENSNTGYSMQGLTHHISSYFTSEFWLNKLYNEKIKKTHKEGWFHIHDLGFLSSYCCFTGDTKVPLLDGRTMTLKEISETNEQLYVYSCDKDGSIKAGKIIKSGLTKRNSKLVQVELDNGEIIKCTPDHLFMLRNGEYKEAKLLKQNDSLMPLYKFTTKNGYNYINSNRDKRPIGIHRELLNAENGYVVHHLNGNKTDNRPENLEIMLDSDHRRMEFNKTFEREEYKDVKKQNAINLNKSEEQRKKSSYRAKKRNISDKQRAFNSYGHIGIEIRNKINKDDYINFVEANGYISCKYFLNKHNHKIVSVKILEYREDVYDITVDKYHNFALDSGVFVHNCGWDFKDILISGFGGVESTVESKPPRHLSSALGQTVNFLYTLQGEAAGAQALSSFDTYMAPFIRFNNMTRKQIKKELRSFIFQCNTKTRVGFQAPFINTTMDLFVKDSSIKDDFVFYGDKYLNVKYSDFQKEMDIFNSVFIEVMNEGDKKGRPFSFPIPTYNLTKNMDWDSEIVNEVFEMTSKYGTPYFANYINSDMEPSDARSMCCRLRLDNRELRKRGGGLFGSNPLTGSIGVVTLNLPKIAFESKDKDDFIKNIKKYADIAKESLEIKRKLVENYTENDLYPYTKNYLKNIKEKTGNYWTNHFSTIGVVGGNEACINLLNKGIMEEDSKQLMIDVLDHLRDLMLIYQEETGNNYNLEATPAESTAYRLAMKDKKYYHNKIYTSGDDQPFYTNSTQAPSDYSEDLFEIIEHQNELQTKYTGGTVFHIYNSEGNLNTKTVKEMIKKIATNYEMPYVSYTPSITICNDHGRFTGEFDKCPDCGKETEVYTRVVGYYRAKKRFNDGKIEEFKNKKYFNDKKLINK